MAQIQAFVVAVYCYARDLCTYLRQEPLAHFSKACPFWENLLIGQHCGTTFWLYSKSSGC